MATKKQSPLNKQRGRQIVGFSLSPETAKEVKIEAARRKTTLRKLFTEIWELYKAKKNP
jgi:hypothetical protein